jgi:adenylosuccinate lyase
LDASLAVLLRSAADEILAGIDLLMAALARKADAHRGTLMIGRSHGIHAEPITAGLVFAGFFSEISRARRALVAAREEISVGKLAGAVGTYASLDPETEIRALGTMGLHPEVVPTQIVARDRHAGFFLALARLGTAIERMALTVRHWQRTEVGEAREAFGRGQKGSSAMPHKKNPILSENLCGLARLLRAYSSSALENVALWHERDISHSSVERVIGPDATGIADFMVRRAASLVDGLVVNADRMHQNLEFTGGLFFSEAVMLALVHTGMARQAAYELVQKHALAASENLGKTAAPGTSFRERLGADPEISSRLTAADLDRAFDLNHHLRWSGAIIDRALRDRE